MAQIQVNSHKFVRLGWFSNSLQKYFFSIIILFHIFLPKINCQFLSTLIFLGLRSLNSCYRPPSPAVDPEIVSITWLSHIFFFFSLVIVFLQPNINFYMHIGPDARERKDTWCHAATSQNRNMQVINEERKRSKNKSGRLHSVVRTWARGNWMVHGLFLHNGSSLTHLLGVIVQSF